MSANADAVMSASRRLRSRPSKAGRTPLPTQPQEAILSSKPSPSSRRKSKHSKASRSTVSSVVPIAESADSQLEHGSQKEVASAGLSLIKELHRRRQDFLNAEGALTRQIKAIERRMQTTNPQEPSESLSASVPSNGGDISHRGVATLFTNVGVSSDLIHPDSHKSFVGGDAGHQGNVNHARVASVSSNLVTLQLQVAEDHIRKQRKLVERELVKAAKELPVYSAFVEPINGFGALGLAQIVGEAGDLSKYSNPAKLWKRFGLGLVGGERQRRHTDPEKAIAHGYSPRRRSVMFVIGDSLLKKQNAYKDLYDERKRYEEQKAIAAGLVVRAAKPGDPVDQVSAGFRSKMVIHRRSQRYVEKRLLRDLWRSWRDHRSRVCR